MQFSYNYLSQTGYNSIQILRIFTVGIDNSSQMADEFLADEQIHFELGSLSTFFYCGL